MTKIELTPEFLMELTPPVIHISRRIIIFPPSAAKKLALKINDRFVLDIESDKLQFRPSASKGFIIKSKSAHCIQSPVNGLLEYLVKYFKIIPQQNLPKLASLTFEIGDFREGANPLTYLSYKQNKKSAQ